jgi:hypothetical protein
MAAVADYLLVLVYGVVGCLADLCAVGAAIVAALRRNAVADSVGANLLAFFHSVDNSPRLCSMREQTHDEKDDCDDGDEDEGR